MSDTDEKLYGSRIRAAILTSLHRYQQEGWPRDKRTGNTSFFFLCNDSYSRSTHTQRSALVNDSVTLLCGTSNPSGEIYYCQPTWHSWGFSPVWTRWCFWRWASCVKLFLQRLHWNGLSPLCTRRWTCNHNSWAMISVTRWHPIKFGLFGLNVLPWGLTAVQTSLSRCYIHT